MSAEFTQVTKSCLLSAFVFEVFLVSQGRSYGGGGQGGGSWGALNLPFVSLIFKKTTNNIQVAKTGVPWKVPLVRTQCVPPFENPGYASAVNESQLEEE